MFMDGSMSSITNVGLAHVGGVVELPEEEWDRIFAVNLKGCFLTMKHVIPIMEKQGGGSIINISSIASSVSGLPLRYVYGASKAAVIGLTKSVAADFIKKGVRANAICPGTVQSPSLDERIATLAKNTGQTEAKVRQAFIDRQPMGRLGTAEEIAALVVYLASDESAYTTGAVHVIDGGWSM